MEADLSKKITNYKIVTHWSVYYNFVSNRWVITFAQRASIGTIPEKEINRNALLESSKSGSGSISNGIVVCAKQSSW